ncbi:MAG: DUF423 domain-containing protein [Verrucomicrobiota bacterium]
MSAVTGASAVALGAFGAHGLEEQLAERGLTDVWKTASMYHLVHAVLLFSLGFIQPFPMRRWWTFFLGVLIFSGTLYLMGLTGWTKLGMITPLGGTLLIAGWISLAFAFSKSK